MMHDKMMMHDQKITSHLQFVRKRIAEVSAFKEKPSNYGVKNANPPLQFNATQQLRISKVRGEKLSLYSQALYHVQHYRLNNINQIENLLEKALDLSSPFPDHIRHSVFIVEDVKILTLLCEAETNALKLNDALKYIDCALCLLHKYTNPEIEKRFDSLFYDALCKKAMLLTVMSEFEQAYVCYLKLLKIRKVSIKEGDLKDQLRAHRYLILTMVENILDRNNFSAFKFSIKNEMSQPDNKSSMCECARPHLPQDMQLECTAIKHLRPLIKLIAEFAQQGNGHLTKPCIEFINSCSDAIPLFHFLKKLYNFQTCDDREEYKCMDSVEVVKSKIKKGKYTSAIVHAKRALHKTLSANKVANIALLLSKLFVYAREYYPALSMAKKGHRLCLEMTKFIPIDENELVDQGKAAHDYDLFETLGYDFLEVIAQCYVYLRSIKCAQYTIQIVKSRLNERLRLILDDESNDVVILCNKLMYINLREAIIECRQNKLPLDRHKENATYAERLTDECLMKAFCCEQIAVLYCYNGQIEWALRVLKVAIHMMTDKGYVSRANSLNHIYNVIENSRYNSVKWAFVNPEYCDMLQNFLDQYCEDGMLKMVDVDEPIVELFSKTMRIKNAPMLHTPYKYPIDKSFEHCHTAFEAKNEELSARIRLRVMTIISEGFFN